MFKSAEYWDSRYRRGNNSGWGSYGKLARFKADIINDFIERSQVQSVIDFGCGDGNQLGLFKVPDYLGADVSKEAIRICTEKYKGDVTKGFMTVSPPEYLGDYKAELVLSLDVIFHLVEHSVYSTYMNSLFHAATRFVIIYSSNFERVTAAHEREREFTSYVEILYPEWELVEKIDNPWPIAKYSDGSLSDFYIYRKGGQDA